MAKDLNDLLKKELVEMVENLQKENKKLSENPSEIKTLQEKLSDLEEENRLLMIQQENDTIENKETEKVSTVSKHKKLTDMSELEIVAHMQKKLNQKVL